MALGTAEAAYGKLGLAMERFAGSRDDRLKELATARAASDDGLPGQAKKLTVLAASWLSWASVPAQDVAPDLRAARGGARGI